MKIFFYFLYAIAQIYFLNSAAATSDFRFKSHNYQILFDSQYVYINRNGAEVLKLKILEDAERPYMLEDFNFDGYPDVAILRDAGIEKYYDVYLFAPNDERYKKNTFLSKLACPMINESARTLVASCYHANACDAWSDTYRYVHGFPVLIRRDGTNCDPTNGAGFKYYEIYKNGKMVRHKSAPIIEK